MRTRSYACRYSGLILKYREEEGGLAAALLDPPCVGLALRRSREARTEPGALRIRIRRIRICLHRDDLHRNFGVNVAAYIYETLHFQLFGTFINCTIDIFLYAIFRSLLWNQPSLIHSIIQIVLYNKYGDHDLED